MTTDPNSRLVALEDRARRDARLYSPSATRNAVPIRDVLTALLPADARVMEIGSGTGQHGEACCQARWDIHWQTSELDPDSRGSCAARANDLPGLLAPLAIDASVPDWHDGLDMVDALVCMNVIHIAPWRVAEGLVASASKLVREGGFLFLYGPFKDGAQTAPSNLDFDASLRMRNPDWGVRDLDAVVSLLAEGGFALERRIGMPANNLSLIFRRSA
ncbi:MAG: hypothetical protein CMF74_08260 [Maricaulis sp.]|jgi:SAM-dependent methyltransferase|nr:hypothetical protein [Maricaulis sp.]HAQ35448.1 hypothetical protein [Alphaproteobacteria bacterium]